MDCKQALKIIFVVCCKYKLKLKFIKKVKAKLLMDDNILKYNKKMVIVFIFL